MSNSFSTFIDKLVNIHPIKLHDWRRELRESLPQLSAMAVCPQDRLWHAEGDVLTHTEMVMDAARAELASSDLPTEIKQAVYLAALLHDVGKPRTTFMRDNRIVSPGHSAAGLPIARELLYRFKVPFQIRELTLMLILRHMVAYRMVERIPFDLRLRGVNVERKRYWRLANEVNLPALYYLTRADWLGRIGTGIDRVLDLMESFRRRCQHHNIWQNGLNVINELADSETLEKFGVSTAQEQQRVRHELLAMSLAGQLETGSDIEQYLASHPEICRPTTAQLYLTIGMPGSGKSTWLKEHLFCTKIVSSDVKRIELFGDVNWQGDNARVFKECYLDIEQALKNGEKVALDATNTRLNQRTAFLHLARQLHAHTTIIYFDVSLDVALERNSRRARQVPKAAIMNYFHNTDAPRRSESQELIVVAE